MFNRQTSGSVVCTSCGSLVGVNDERCYNCGRVNPGLWGFAPLIRSFGQDMGLVSVVVGGCATLYVVSLLMSGATAIQFRGLLGFLSPSSQSLLLLGASGAIPVFGLGHWWSVLSATWLHGSLLHIFFNMMWVRQLGPVTAQAYGPGRMVIIYTVAGVVGFLLSSLAGQYLPGLPFLQGARLTIGASASIFGLLGAMVYYGRRAGSSMMRSEALRYAIILGVFGLIMPGIDNYAHGGGFLGGYLAARWLDPLQPERIDHIAGGIICLVASLLAVVASLISGLRLLS